MDLQKSFFMSNANTKSKDNSYLKWYKDARRNRASNYTTLKVQNNNDLMSGTGSPELPHIIR